MRHGRVVVVNMKIGNPIESVAAVPAARASRRKYTAMYDAAEAAEGLWVPVEFESRPKRVNAYNAFKAAARASRSGSSLSRMEVLARGLTLYVRVKPVLKAVTA